MTSISRRRFLIDLGFAGGALALIAGLVWSPSGKTQPQPTQSPEHPPNLCGSPTPTAPTSPVCGEPKPQEQPVRKHAKDPFKRADAPVDRDAIPGKMVQPRVQPVRNYNYAGGKG